MASPESRLPLFGRRRECDALDRLMSTVRGGESSVVVLRGEAGIGKTALLDYAWHHAAGLHVVRAAGVESEMELPFGGLHQLCAPFLNRLDRLPGPQRDALGTAFGRAAGTPPDRFLVGLSVLSLLADAAAERPLLGLIDDSQWLDQVSLQTLAFVARRLLAEPIGLVLAVREPVTGSELIALRHLEVDRLSDGDAGALLDTAVPGPLDERVRNRIVAETHGNPLALLELPRGLAPAELAGGFARPDVRPLANQIEQSFLRRVRELPPDTQMLLLLAAAEPVGDVALLNRAARLLGLDPSAAVPAETAGLIRLGTRVRFRHPLVRSAAYRAARPPDRERVHGALAEVTDPRTDPERRAWHRANATTNPDEEVAAELERSADRAQARGGLAAAAAFLERAADLTADPVRRGQRALAAAKAKFQAGGFDAALELLDAAELSPLTERARAESTLVRGQILFASRSAGAGLPVLLRAAQRLEPLDAGLARETYRDALYAASTAGSLPSGTELADIAAAALAAPPSPHPGRNDQLVNGLARMTTESYAAGLPLVREAVHAFRTEEISEQEALTWLPLAARMAHNIWDYDNFAVLSERLVGAAREMGALSVLPSALLLLVSAKTHAGELAVADSLVAEAMTIGEVTGSRFFAEYGALVLEPWRGLEESTLRVIAAVEGDTALRGEGKVLTATQWAGAVLYNGLGRYEEAYAAASRGSANIQELGLATWSLIEMVEAAVRSGKPERAAAAATQIEEMARAAGTDFALGTAANVRAQVASSAAAAEEAYRESIDRLGRTRVRVLQARTHLLFGEWLRRESRRTDARRQLGIAYEMLGRIGANAFADRAARELSATGEAVRRRAVSPARVTLTAQEAQIARLARDGLTNPEIGAQLFISPHTVEWHLRKVYTKLGITSRRQLRAEFAEGMAATA